MSTITAVNFERIPKPKHGSEDWLRLRWRDSNGRCTFGASDAPALMGASPYSTRSDLFYDKSVDPTVEEDKPVFAAVFWLRNSLKVDCGNRVH